MAKVLNSDMFVNFFINAQKVSSFSDRYIVDINYIVFSDLNKRKHNENQRLRSIWLFILI